MKTAGEDYPGSFPYADVGSLLVGSIRYRNHGTVLILDLEQAATLMGRPIDGILGGYTLNAADYRLDLGGKNLEINTNLKVKDAEDAKPLRRTSNNWIYLPVFIDGHKLDFLLDTGSSISTIDRTTLEKLGDYPTKSVGLTIHTLNSVETKMRQYARTDVSLGSVAAEDFFLLLDTRNTIGLDFLEKGVLTLSAKDGHFTFRSPSKNQ